MKFLVCIISIALALPMAVAEAKDVKFEASLDKDRIAIGETAQLGLSFQGTQSMPAPDIGNISGLEIRYVGPSTMMTVINGLVTSSVTHMYAVQPLKIGRFQIGPFSFQFKNDSYTSNMVFLEVLEEKIAPLRREEPETLEKLNLEDRLFAVLNVAKPAAYVNELIPVTVKLYVNRLNVSDIQLPTFSQEGFSKVEFKEPKQYREELNGLLYDVLEFKTSIFSTRPGEYRLGPAKIKCNLVLRKRQPVRAAMRTSIFPDDEDDAYRDSFFDDFTTRYERHPLELKSQDVQLIVSPLPSENRPNDFTGAVGDYQFIYKATPAKVKVGDPVTLRMDINGAGNFNTVLIPHIDNTTGFKLYEPQVKTEGNTKAFMQVLIPETEMVTQVPKATFSYFDPNAREYKTITQGPMPLQVEKGKDELPSQVIGPLPQARAPEGMGNEELGRDIVYIKQSYGKWVAKDYRAFRTRMFAAFIVLPFIFLVSLYLLQERRNRLKRDVAYASHVAASRAASKGLKQLRRQIGRDPKVFYEVMFDTMQEYLGNRLQIPPAGITSDVVEAALLSRELDMGIIATAKRLFKACDEARFASVKMDGLGMRGDFRDVETIIRYLERRRV